MLLEQLSASYEQIDGFIQEYSVFVTQGKKEGIYKKVLPVFGLKSTDLHVMFSNIKHSPEILTVFNQQLKRLHENGQY